MASISKTRRIRGSNAYHAGRAAEQIARRLFEARGATLLEERWRGQGGEIDLIFDEDGVTVFVEVKRAQHFSNAATQISARQAMRIMQSAQDYVGRLPRGQLSDLRIDVALVDGSGACQIIENAFAP